MTQTVAPGTTQILTTRQCCLPRFCWCRCSGSQASDLQHLIQTGPRENPVGSSLVTRRDANGAPGADGAPLRRGFGGASQNGCRTVSGNVSQSDQSDRCVRNASASAADTTRARRVPTRANRTLRIALTKRAVTKQLMRAGSPRKEAEQVVARLPHAQLWRKLPAHVQSEIAWKAGKAERTNGHT